MLSQSLATLDIATPGRGFVEVTGRVGDWVAGSGIGTACSRCSCATPRPASSSPRTPTRRCARDLERFFARLVPDGDRLYEHADEGPDDMPAHVRAALTQTHLAVPVQGGRLALGTWQGIFLWEHRRAAHRRQLVLHLLGEAAAARGAVR